MSSLANAGAGDLLFGISENPNGEPDKISPLPSQQLDAQIKRLDTLIITGIHPRIPGIQTNRVTGTGGSAVVLRISRSWVEPQRVTIKGDDKF